MATLRRKIYSIWIVPMNPTNDVTVTSNYITLSIKLCLDVGNNDTLFGVNLVAVALEFFLQL